jgi:hypothetical protein
MIYDDDRFYLQVFSLSPSPVFIAYSLEMSKLVLTGVAFIYRLCATQLGIFG